MNYLKFLADEIHTTIAATVDGNGLPVTCAVDMMDADENGLYFLTAKGKSFYDRLVQSGYISLTALKGNSTMDSIAVSVRGNVKEIGGERLPDLMMKNPYMFEIYSSQASRQALTVFQIYKGEGEWFDLSKKPIERIQFAFGNAEKKQVGYYINENCTGCQTCGTVCPQSCIDFSSIPAVISQTNCLHCGNCQSVCPVGAAVKR